MFTAQPTGIKQNIYGTTNWNKTKRLLHNQLEWNKTFMAQPTGIKQNVYGTTNWNKTKCLRHNQLE